MKKLFAKVDVNSSEKIFEVKNINAISATILLDENGKTLKIELSEIINLYTDNQEINIPFVPISSKSFAVFKNAKSCNLLKFWEYDVENSNNILTILKNDRTGYFVKIFTTKIQEDFEQIIEVTSDVNFYRAKYTTTHEKSFLKVIRKLDSDYEFEEEFLCDKIHEIPQETKFIG